MKLIREYIRFLIEQVGAPKVIFMAGGPGSGKSTVIRRLGLSNRLEVINPDDQYEETMRAEGIPADRAKLLDEYKPIKDQYTAAQEAGDGTLVAACLIQQELRVAFRRPPQIRLRVRGQCQDGALSWLRASQV